MKKEIKIIIAVLAIIIIGLSLGSVINEISKERSLNECIGACVRSPKFHQVEEACIQACKLSHYKDSFLVSGVKGLMIAGTEFIESFMTIFEDREPPIDREPIDLERLRRELNKPSR